MSENDNSNSEEFKEKTVSDYLKEICDKFANNVEKDILEIVERPVISENVKK